MRGLGNKRTLITGGVYALTNEDGGAIPVDFYALAIVAPVDRGDHSPSVWGLISGCQKKLSLKILPITRVSVARMPGMA